jgi:hypothetical protein
VKQADDICYFVIFMVSQTAARICAFTSHLKKGFYLQQISAVCPHILFSFLLPNPKGRAMPGLGVNKANYVRVNPNL